MEKDIREKIKAHKEKLRQNRAYLKALKINYEKVVQEHRNQIEELIDNAPKAMLLWLRKKVIRK